MVLTVSLVAACSSGEDKTGPASTAKPVVKPTAGSPPSGPQMRYKDSPLTLGGRPQAGGITCEHFWAALYGDSPHTVEASPSALDGTDLSVFACRSGDAELGFSKPDARAIFQVTGAQDGRSCNEAMKSGKASEIKDGIPLLKLKVGQQFCITHPYNPEKGELLRVRQVLPPEGKVTLSVTAWEGR
ncbi:hypothetical protein [Streptomyces lydicus]|uniref:hypothetical protein n=1 Tax=Streptomyces lydicus TaxID=47763 RepID=UPI0010121A65|nr:hypothetical protein [Streptomyces lydicus]MCZ1010340.1 hypothetical protein [Streptomyces lydicus]